MIFLMLKLPINAHYNIWIEIFLFSCRQDVPMLSKNSLEKKNNKNVCHVFEMLSCACSYNADEFSYTY